MQGELAKRLGVHVESLKNWERGVTSPTIRHIPKILEFLGYNPEPQPESQADRIVYARRQLGLAQEQLAQMLAIDLVTLYRWENGLAATPTKTLQKIEQPTPAARQITRQ
jgi:DNA-binding transcriptional regulator YiaG